MPCSACLKSLTSDELLMADVKAGGSPVAAAVDLLIANEPGGEPKQVPEGLKEPQNRKPDGDNDG